MIPRVFVGTMYSNEGDFTACTNAIKSQQGVVLTHSVVAGMKEKDAHNALWQEWRNAKLTHELFVKVDADTVLATSDVLVQIWKLFEHDNRVTGVQCPLHDYMTDDLINGLNSFSPVVVFSDTRDGLYCDRVDTGHDVVLRGEQLPVKLRPAGYHCHKATPVQAFHYGLHRALKKQHDVIQRIKIVWAHERDAIRRFALLGALAAPQFVKHQHFNYTDPEFITAYETAYNKHEQLEPLL